MGVYVATDPLEVNQVLRVIHTEINKIQEGGISKTDLEAAQEHLIGGILLGSENTDSRMMRLAKNEYVFGRYIGYEELVASLESVTIDDVVAIAGKAFHSQKVSLVTLGPLKEQDLDLEYLQLLF